MIKEFKKAIKEDGRTFKWFHKKYIKDTMPNYNYFIMQLNNHAQMHNSIKTIIEKYMNEC